MLLGCQFMMESMPCDINSLYDINRIKEGYPKDSLKNDSLEVKLDPPNKRY
jgi:hypothetical protein